MTWVYIFTAFLIAHIISDFAVRREFIHRDNKMPSQRAWLHVLVFLGLSVILLSALGSLGLLLSVAAASFHWLTDFAFRGTALWKPEAGSKQRWFFVIQQGIKVLALILLSTMAVDQTLWKTGYSIVPLNSLNLNFDANTETAILSIPVSQILLGYVFGYVFALFVGDAFVSFILTCLKWQPEVKIDTPKGAGPLIGIFEALLVTTFVIGYQYGAVGLVLAAKSVARFEWLKNNQGRGEYFLIGTLARITCAVAGGLLALCITGRPLFPQ